MPEAPPEKRQDGMPRGVLVVVAVGLLACVLAALLTADKSSGEAADLEWVQSKPLADSQPVEVPGGGGQMQIVGAGLRATGTNASGYSLVRSIAVLELSAGSPVGSARINCTMRAPEGSEIAQGHNVRATYPRSSEELYDQEVPEVLLLDFSSHGDEFAVVPVGDFPERFATERGIKVEWPERAVRNEGWHWFLPAGKPQQDLVLPFATVWKTTAVPAVKISCTVITSAGESTARTKGALPEQSEPIAE